MQRDAIMKPTLKNLIIALLVMLIAFGSMYAGYQAGLAEKNQRQLERIPEIKEIQRLVGCEKIDGKLGRETQTKWDRAIFNQYASNYQK